MAEIVNKADGYIVVLGASVCYRSVLNAMQESNLGELIEEWAELVSGNRQNETLALVISAYEAFKVRCLKRYATLKGVHRRPGEFLGILLVISVRGPPPSEE